MERRKSWQAEDLDVFRRAYQLSLQLHRASEYAGLADQLRRASKSVCGLIVEGSGRQAASPKEFARYLMMAVGSAEETRLWLRYALDLGYMPSEQAEHWREEVAHVIRMLQGLRARLEARREPSDH